MSPTSDDLLASLRKRIPHVDCAGLAAELADSDRRQQLLLVDVRDHTEYSAGCIPGAVHLSRSHLEMNIEEVESDRHRTIIVYCASGNRSLFAGEGLQRLGYDEVRYLAGGFDAWREARLECEKPLTLDAAARERYSRHLLIPEVGEKGQLALLGARVLLVGAGGLGSPAACYLAAAGVGTVGIVDFDVVDRTNLQRQILHTDARVGQSKVDSARETLLALNPDIEVEGFDERLSSSNVERIFSGFDVIVDGSDNFPTRYLCNDACIKLDIPNVHGSIYRFDGQVTVFWPGKGPCYRCLYPEPPPAELAPSCAQSGVLGVLPGVVGMLEAVEAIKIILGVGETLVGRLLHYDALTARFREFKLQRDLECSYCGPDQEFPGYIDYEQFCSRRSDS